MPRAERHPVRLGSPDLLKKANCIRSASMVRWPGSRRLQTQDEARLERLWTLAPRDKALLERGVTAFVRRYPDASATRRCGSDSSTCGGDLAAMPDRGRRGGGVSGVQPLDLRRLGRTGGRSASRPIIRTSCRRQGSLGEPSILASDAASAAAVRGSGGDGSSPPARRRPAAAAARRTSCRTAPPSRPMRTPTPKRCGSSSRAFTPIFRTYDLQGDLQQLASECVRASA